MNFIHKLVLSSFICFSVTIVNGFAIEEANIKPVAMSSINEILEIVKSNQSETQKKEKVFPIVAKTLDLAMISQICLGNYWKNLTEEQKNIFITQMSLKLKNALYDKLALYTNEKLEYGDVVKVNPKRISLPTKIKVSTNNEQKGTNLTFKFFLNEQQSWFMYDLEVEGISFVQSYRTQFQEMLSQNTDFNVFIEKISNVKQ